MFLVTFLTVSDTVYIESLPHVIYKYVLFLLFLDNTGEGTVV